MSDYLSPPEWVNKNNFNQWRQFLKKELLHKRHYRSDFSGKALTLSAGCHLHEGIITRARVPLSVSWHVLIYNEINSFLLLPEEHIPQPPPPCWCVLRAYELYGRDAVRQWFYEELQWKNKPPFEIP